MFTGQDWIRIRLELLRAQQFTARMWEATKSTQAFAFATNRATIATDRFNKSQFLHNQLMFTGRRLAFYGTLTALSLGAAIVKLGFSYESTLQQARVALLPVLGSVGNLNKELNILFGLAALSPFQFKDIVTGFTTFYKAAHLSGLGVTEVNRTLQNITDALSAVPGKATAANLNRVTTAFQHMLNLGRPTGRLMYQLASLGIPIEAVLKKQLHLTDIQIRNIARSGITTKQVLDAFNKFVETTQGYTGQAAATQLNTLVGTWSSFKDFLSQAAGGGTGGMFNFLTKALRNVDMELGNITKSGKAATMTDVAKAWDKELSPTTHIVINLFTLLEYTLKSMIGTWMVLAKILQIVLWPLAKISSLFGANVKAMKLLGIVLGITIGLWAAYKTAVIVAAIAQDVAALSTWGLTKAQRVLAGTEGLIAVIRGWRTWAFATEEAFIASQGIYGSVKANNGLFARFSRTLFGTTAAMEGLTVAEGEATAGATALDVALGPVGLVAVLVMLIPILIVLYFRWKRFHDLVNGTVHWFKENWFWAKTFLNVFGPLGAITSMMIDLYKVLKSIYDLINHPVKTSRGFLTNLLHRAYQVTAPYTKIPYLGKYADPFHYLPRRQFGGMAGGWNLVGERGPEAVRLPGGSRVFNQTQLASGFGRGGGGFTITVVPQAIYLDRQKVGEVVASVVTDRKARL